MVDHEYASRLLRWYWDIGQYGRRDEIATVRVSRFPWG